MGFPEPYDWNQNGKTDIEDWIIEEEQRRLCADHRKQQHGKKSYTYPDPPATDSDTRLAFRVWITLGISAAVFLFFFMLDMLYAAMLGTLAVLLLLAFFFVLPATGKKD